MYQPEGNDGPAIGKIKDKVDPCCTNHLKDCAFFNDAGGYNQYRKIAKEQADGGTDFYIKGIVTNTTLDNHVGTDELYYHQGYYAGRLDGTLTGTTEWGVKSTHDTTNGDSGGPLFAPSDNDAFIAGHHVKEEGPYDEDGELKCRDNSGAMKAQEVENVLNGHYMTTDDTLL